MCLRYGVSIRKVCATFLVHRTAFYYRSRKIDQVVLQQRIKDIAFSRVSYGYRRVHTHLTREGFQVNHKRVYRMYSELCLQMRKKKPKRCIQAKIRENRLLPERKNDVWSMDFNNSGCLHPGKPSDWGWVYL